MQEKLTILISPEHKRFIKRYARRHNKSISRFIDDLLASVKRNELIEKTDDDWVNATAGSYTTGKKDVFNEIFRGIRK